MCHSFTKIGLSSFLIPRATSFSAWSLVAHAALSSGSNSALDGSDPCACPPLKPGKPLPDGVLHPVNLSTHAGLLLQSNRLPPSRLRIAPWLLLGRASAQLLQKTHHMNRRSAQIIRRSARCIFFCSFVPLSTSSHPAIG